MLFSASLLLLFSTAHSQLTQGNWLVGGNASFSSTTYNSEGGQKNTDFVLQLSPDIGYFLADKFAAGLKVSVGATRVKATAISGDYNKYTDANFGPFLRYYFLDSEKQFNLLAEGAYQYGFFKSSYDSNLKNTFSLNMGPVIYFNSSVAMEFLVGYSTYKIVGYSGNNNTVQVSLGIQAHLERNK